MDKFMKRKFRPDFNRLLDAINHKCDPKYVPMLELHADPEVIGELLEEPIFSLDDQDDNPEFALKGVDQRIRFWTQLGFDAIPEGPPLLFPGTLQLKTEDSSNSGRGERRWVDEKKGVISSWKDFELYPWPDPNKFSFRSVEYAIDHLPEGMGIVGRGAGVFEMCMYLMGYETLSTGIYDQPDLVKAVFDRTSEILLSVLKKLVQFDRVIALFVADDMGFRTGTLIAPKHIRQYVIPFHKKAAEIAHNEGIPYLLHSCGKLDKIMDDLIDAGIDAKHSYEDAIEPVESFVERYSDRLAIIGGLDIDLLSRGTQEDVRKRTRQILESCSPSRSYILGSGNSIVNYISLENYLVMIDECHKFNS